MSKPPTSVRSIRLPDELWVTIQADALARGEKVNAVIARHLRIAYAPENLTVEKIVDVTLASPMGSRIVKRLNEAERASGASFGPLRAKPGERLKAGKVKK